MKMKDLESYYGTQISIAGETFTLNKQESQYGMVPVWKSDVYNIYALLNFQDFKMVVEVTIADKENKSEDFLDCMIGGYKCKHKIPNFEAYVAIITTVMEMLVNEDVLIKYV